MLENRSVPATTILPHVTYRDVAGATAWLTATFGFIEHYRYGEPVSGAQLRLGDAWIMLARADATTSSPARIGHSTQYLTVFVTDVEAHYHCARAAGAKKLEEPHETVYGEFQYAAEDCDGHRCLFSRHARDVAPEEWGAIVAFSPC